MIVIDSFYKESINGLRIIIFPELYSSFFGRNHPNEKYYVIRCRDAMHGVSVKVVYYHKVTKAIWFVCNSISSENQSILLISCLPIIAIISTISLFNL